MSALLSKFLPNRRAAEANADNDTNQGLTGSPQVDEKRPRSGSDTDDASARSVKDGEVTTAVDPTLNPGELSFEEGTPPKFIAIHW